MADDVEEPTYETGVEYFDAEVMPIIEETVFSEAVSMYKANERTFGWIKQMEDEEAK